MWPEFALLRFLRFKMRRGIVSPAPARHSARVLASLRIRNLALVEDLEWNLKPGFVAITGETGSGKLPGY